jgi:hypothetical protein
MDQTDPARDLDPLRSLAEAALARQDTAQRQRADDQAAVDRDQAAQAETADTPRPSPRPNNSRVRCSGPRVPSWPRP